MTLPAARCASSRCARIALVKIPQRASCCLLPDLPIGRCWADDICSPAEYRALTYVISPPCTTSASRYAFALRIQTGNITTSGFLFSYLAVPFDYANGASGATFTFPGTLLTLLCKAPVFARASNLGPCLRFSTSSSCRLKRRLYLQPYMKAKTASPASSPA